MGTLPSWAKGRQRECFRCGWGFPERDWRIHKNSKGRWECHWCKDTLTEEERRDLIKH